MTHLASCLTLTGRPCLSLQVCRLCPVVLRLGPKGPPGPSGVPGATGFTGPVGFHGPVGSAGGVGATGATGATGLPGSQSGPPGLPGARGQTGAKGSQGKQLLYEMQPLTTLNISSRNAWHWTDIKSLECMYWVGQKPDCF